MFRRGRYLYKEWLLTGLGISINCYNSASGKNSGDTIIDGGTSAQGE